MMTVNEVSKLSGVSIRALQYYDKIGLLHPTGYTESGYRLYDSAALEKLREIMLFRELEFSLQEIKAILQSPDFDRDRALEQQIKLLELKREHFDNLITFACGLISIFADFGKLRDGDPASKEAQLLAKGLQSYITENYYTCTPEILRSLGAMYCAGGEFTENIDAAGGEGTASFAAKAIDIYCR